VIFLVGPHATCPSNHPLPSAPLGYLPSLSMYGDHFLSLLRSIEHDLQMTQPRRSDDPHHAGVRPSIHPPDA
jgi:hypothetical protein